MFICECAPTVRQPLLVGEKTFNKAQTNVPEVFTQTPRHAQEMNPVISLGYSREHFFFLHFRELVRTSGCTGRTSGYTSRTASRRPQLLSPVKRNFTPGRARVAGEKQFDGGPTTRSRVQTRRIAKWTTSRHHIFLSVPFLSSPLVSPLPVSTFLRLFSLSFLPSFLLFYSFLYTFFRVSVSLDLLRARLSNDHGWIRIELLDVQSIN